MTTKAVKRKVKSFNGNSNSKVQSFRSLSESLFFACAKKSNQKKAHPGLRVPPAYAVGVRSASGNFSTVHPCTVEKLGHPALRPHGFCPLAPPLRLYGAPKAEEQKQQQHQKQLQLQQQNQKQQQISPGLVFP